MTGRLMLLDTASLYFRAFYGVPETVKAPDGTPVNATRGLLDIIAKLVTEYRPRQLVACWDDAWRPQWRVELVPSYKAHRVAGGSPDGGWVEETPEGLVRQLPLIREVLAVLGIPVIGAADHEADDVIGTLTTHAESPVDIVTGDRDLFQLVDDAADARAIYTARGMSNLEVVTGATLEAKYGISPAQYADFAVLRGDTSDGLPGVAGIGEKTAAGLLREFGRLDAIVQAAEDASAPLGAAVRSRILAARDYLTAASRVVAVVRDLDVKVAPDEALVGPLDAESAREAERLSERWGLGGAMTRAARALEWTPA